MHSKFRPSNNVLLLLQPIDLVADFQVQGPCFMRKTMSRKEMIRKRYTLLLLSYGPKCKLLLRALAPQLPLYGLCDIIRSLRDQYRCCFDTYKLISWVHTVSVQCCYPQECTTFLVPLVHSEGPGAAYTLCGWSRMVSVEGLSALVRPQEAFVGSIPAIPPTQITCFVDHVNKLE
jgi:hypothetical protein